MGKMPGEATKREKCHLGVQDELLCHLLLLLVQV